ncbi:MAG: aminotransferase class I/II-fold pyridoxal phosphate-dependent enzyme [Pseudomonadales bacterium]
MIPDDLLSLLAPLERVEAIRRKVVRLGDRLCDFSYANPYGGVQKSARAAIRSALDDARVLDLQYTPFGGQTLARRAVADALRVSHGLGFGYRDVVLTPGAMAALHASLHACGRPGDEVIVPTPCWLDYPLYVRAAGRVPVMVPLRADGLGLDVDAVAAAITGRTCAVLLSQPANPSGRHYAPQTLAALAAAIGAGAARHGCQVTLIADETHRDFVTTEQFCSPATYYDRTMLVYSFGKYHFLQGQRLGYLAVSPQCPRHEAVAGEVTQWMRILGLATPTALMQKALPELLELRHDLSWLQAWRARVGEALATQGYAVAPADATLFMYVRTPDGHGDMEFTELLARQGVLVLPAPVFHHRGYFRLALTASADMLDRALPVFARLRPQDSAQASRAAAANEERLPS